MVTTKRTASDSGMLRDIDDVEPLNEADMPCMQDLREVLVRHGRSDRFGIALLHKHFDLAEDEVLVERTNVESRVQTIRPERIDTPGQVTETIWQLSADGPNAILGCRQYCGGDVHGNHGSYHART